MVKHWKLTYQVEESPDYVRETKEVIIEAETREEADRWGAYNIVAPMVQPGRPYIPFVYGSAKIEEIKE